MRIKSLSVIGLLGLALTSLGLAYYSTAQTSAVSSSDWQAGNIVSDLSFTNSNNMTVADIQAFLNSQNPNCDTNGTQPATDKGRSDLTHAQYASLRGWPAPPYVCLKDYYEVPKYTPGDYIPANNFSGSIPSGAISAAQIIYDAAKQNNLNPKVILVKIATESAGPLTSDNWPVKSQYTYAMGSHCPDSGAGGSANCDRNYAGFSMQVESGAELLRWYLDNMSQPWWTYKKPYQVNSILWNVSQTGCGAGDVYVNNQATAALYTYTPYQPNQAALNNMYGTGDGCSAYGNRNFWRVWNDLFGSTQSEPIVAQFKSHLSNYGWTDLLTNRGITGTTGQSRSMQAFKINGSVEYSSYSYSTGWQPTISGGMISGTTSIGRPIQAIKINLTGTAASQYDIFYRAHVSNVGWMGWSKNGDPAGVSGSSTQNIEAFEIQVLPKGSNAPGSTTDSYRNLATISYIAPLTINADAHVGDVGWQPTVTNDMDIGTIEQGKRIEALTLSLANTTGISGGITYSAHVGSIGWQPFVSDGATAGTVGKALQMEAVRIALTGDLSDHYDIWYRAYIQDLGWQGWAKNGAPAGSVGAGKQLEAVEIHIVPKGTGVFPEQSGVYNPKTLSIPDTYSLLYDAHASNIGWLTGVTQNSVGGTTGQARTLEALRFTTINSIYGTLSINCMAYSRGLGWGTSTSLGNTCGTTGQARPLESINLSLTGDAADQYDLYYRVHLSVVGWQNWVKGGTQAGFATDNTTPIEAVSIKLIAK